MLPFFMRSYWRQVKLISEHMKAFVVSCDLRDLAERKEGR